MVNATELPIDINASAIAMANEIFGDGVTVVSASYTGDNRSSGIYSQGDTISPGATPSDTGVILSTGRATGLYQLVRSGEPKQQHIDKHQRPEQQRGFQRAGRGQHL